MRSMKTVFAILALVSLPIAYTQVSPAKSPTGVLIQHVTILDGTGQAPYEGDVRISGDRIVAVAPHLQALPEEEVLDKKGLALAPGFIDMHSHVSRGIFQNPTADVMIRQGITTSLVGQDGESEFPLSDFFKKLEASPVALNLASMVGQGTIREQVMGKDLLRPSTAQELARMQGLVAQEMRSGAFGLSTGLEYDPAHFSTTDEVVELSKVASKFGGFYISHVRDEGNKVFDSFHEITEIGERAAIPVEITHIKLGTTPVWHTAKSQIPKIFETAGQLKVDLKADVYPYTYWHSGIRVIMLDRDYFNPEKVAKAIADNGGADHIRFVHYEPDTGANGKTLAEIADMWRVSPVKAYMRIVKATMPRRDGKSAEEDVIVTSMSEDDVDWFIANPKVMFCTDGGLNMHHPRSAGSFPRILGKYVREKKLLTLQEAVRKATSMPAQQIGLKDRGKIASGYVADLVLFDPATVIDQATVENWNAAPIGIPDVMISGKWVLRAGKITGEKPGKVLLHSSVTLLNESRPSAALHRTKISKPKR